jgi:SAM-dependent methyltransferase
LPFPDETFDGVLAVTLLMYLHEHSRCAFDEIRRVTRPGGSLLLIDPAREPERPARFLAGGRKIGPTSGSGYKWSEYRSIMTSNGDSIVAKGSAVGLTLMLPILTLARSSPLLQSVLVSMAAGLDRLLGRGVRFGFHRWVLLRKHR